MDAAGLPMVNYLLQHTLRSLCFDSQWVYAVFWRILPRNYPPPKWDMEGGILDRSKGNKRNWILVWEDGFCDFSCCSRAANTLSNRCSTSEAAAEEQVVGESFQPDIFFKMSHEVYNYGEGLMGKVAADNSHKWVYKEPPENDINFLSSWHGSLDPHPRTWEAQFKSGIQTIAVVAVREGVIQLGSLHKIVEDLNFVIFLQRKFNYLQSIPGVFAIHPPLSFELRKPKVAPSSSHENIWESGEHHERLPIGSMMNRKNLSPAKDHPQLVGMKRPPDQLMKYGGSCLSPNKAVNLGWNSPQRSITAIPLIPSMSSLQALLSKLPSVTSPDQQTSITPPVLGSVHSPLIQRNSSFNSRSSPQAVANPNPNLKPLDTSEASFQKSCLTLNSTADPSSAHSTSPSAADFADSKLHVLSQQEACSNPPIKECSRENHEQHHHQLNAGLCPNFSTTNPLEFEPHGDIESNDDDYQLFNQIIS